MRSFGFGDTDRRLFGTFHAGVTSSGKQPHGMLLCPPFGQEALRLHRLFRVLADRLSRQGVSTLRFDYFGTGDADGDDDDVDLDGWSRDVRTAHAELQAHVPSAAISWLGAGLGAAAALGAVRDFANGPVRLVLWDPVVHGSEYLDRLRIKHVETLNASYGVPDPAWRHALATDPLAFRDEAVGFAIPSEFRRQILEIAPERIGRDTSCDLEVVAELADEAVRAWISILTAHGHRVVFHQLESQFDWTAEELRGTALVPSDVVRTLLSVCALH